MARLQFDHNGKSHGRIIIDGRRMYGISGFTLVSKPGDLDRLTLDLLIYDGCDIDREVGVYIHRNAQDTLIALGWTPPPIEERTYQTVGTPPQETPTQ